MKLHTTIKYCFLLLLTGGAIIACKKGTDFHKDFLEGGEIVYTGKVDSVKVYAGRNRIALSWLLLSDPRITKCKLLWNEGARSMEIPVQRTANVDTIRVLLPDLEERTYTFDMYTYDDAGHSSVKVSAIGTVYGEKYAKTLFNRPIKSTSFLTNDTAKVTWSGANSQNVRVEVSYTGKSGVIYDVRINKTDTETKLPDFLKGNSISYRTVYVPEANAIDTFYTDFATRQLN